MFNISLFIIHDNKSIIHTYNSVTSQIVNNIVLGEKKVGHLVKTSQRDECRLTDTRCMIKLEPKYPLTWRPKICRLFLYWERSYITHIIEYCMHTWIWTLVLKQTKTRYQQNTFWKKIMASRIYCVYFLFTKHFVCCIMIERCQVSCIEYRQRSENLYTLHKVRIVCQHFLWKKPWFDLIHLIWYSIEFSL